MADVLTETARQVRLPGRAVHKLAGQTFDAERGHVYQTACGIELTGREQAMLTTREVGCGRCLAPSAEAVMARWS